MINATQLRNGVTFLHNNQPHKVLKYNHKHMARGGGTVKVKARNLVTGAIIEIGLRGSDRVDQIDLQKKQMQFLYKDGSDAVFMDENTYEQMQVSGKILGEKVNYLKEGGNCWLLIWEKSEQQQILDVELPASLVFEVAQAAPGEKGNSASNIYKDGILENGLKVRIPLFVNKGDKVKISTEDGSYLERA